MLYTGTLLTAQLALEHGLACNTAGGTHHAQHAAGSGFCIINDLAITALLLRTVMPQRAQRILILDLDVHQGDGTAEILSPQRGGIPPQPSPFSSSECLPHIQAFSTHSDSSAREHVNHVPSGGVLGMCAKAEEAGDRGAGYTRMGKVQGFSLEGNAGVMQGGLVAHPGGGGIYTCSVHADRNFPARKQQSSLDVGLPDGMEDVEYVRCAFN